MKIVIKTAGTSARELKKRLAETEDIHVFAYTDNDAGKWGDVIDGIPVISIFDVFQKYQNKEIDKICVGTNTDVHFTRLILRELKEIGFKQEDVILIPIDYIRGDTKQCSIITAEEYNYLQYVEFHVTNRCNLNCNRCSHFIPLIPKEDEVDIEELERDLYQLKKLVTHISVIRIMGGEPLLSSEICRCCETVKKLYPYANIHIVTNGSLILQMNEELVQTVIQNNIRFDITFYPPFFNVYEKVIHFLNNKGISYSTDVRNEFIPILHKREDKKFRYDTTQWSCDCYNLYRGKLYPCPVAAYIRYYNQYFQESFPEENRLVSIYEEKLTFSELYERLTEKMPLCDYCNHYELTKYNQGCKFEQTGGFLQKESWILDI